MVGLELLLTLYTYTSLYNYDFLYEFLAVYMYFLVLVLCSYVAIQQINLVR